MLRITKMAPEGWAYYAREVAVGFDDYYGGHGEEPGWWMGQGAAAAGVDGRVEVEQLARLFGQGCHPATGEALGRGWDHHDTDVVAGYSVSLSAPKSVSLLWGLGDRRLSQEVRAAHDAAVAATVAYLESHAAFSRSGKGGVFRSTATGCSSPPTSTAPAGPSIPSSTPTCSSRPRCAAPTAHGGPSTAVTYSPSRRRPAASTRPPSEPSSPLGSVSSGRSPVSTVTPMSSGCRTSSGATSQPAGRRWRPAARSGPRRRRHDP